MDYIYVTSSNVTAIAYDEPSATLAVVYGAAEYHYFNVPISIFDGIRTSGSVGGYIDQNVKKAGYAYTRVR